MILGELKDPRVRVSVYLDSTAGWHASIIGDISVGVVQKVQKIAGRLRVQYDLKKE